MIRVLWLSLALVSLSVAQAKPIPATALFDTPAMWDVSLNPSGDLLAAQEMHSEEGYVLSAMTTKDRQLTPILAMANSYQRVGDYTWMDERHLYVELKNRVVDSAVVLTLTTENGLVRSSSKTVQIDAKLVSPLLEDGTVFISADPNGRDSEQLYRVKLDQLFEQKINPKTLVDDALNEVVGFYYEASQQRFFAVQANKATKTLRIQTRLLHDKTWTQVFSQTSTEGMGFTQPAHIAADGTLYVLSNQDHDKIGLYKYDMKAQKLGEQIFEHPRFDLIDAQFDAKDQLQSVTYYDDGRVSRRYFDESNSAEAAALQRLFPKKNVTAFDRSPDGSLQLLSVSANDDPGKVVMYWPKTAQTQVLVENNVNLKDYALLPTEVLNVKSAADVQLEAYLTRPAPANDNKVLLVLPHGGPVGVRDYNVFNPEVQYFASRGFSVLRVNFRGSSGFGRKFVESGVGQFGQKIEQDISAAVEQVKQRYSFNKSCAMGASYGGYSAMMLAILHPTQYQCAVGAYGVYDLPLLFNASNYKADEDWQKRTQKTVGKNSKDLVQFSPVYLSSKLQVPVLLIAGLDDLTAEPEHTRRLAYVLKAANQPVETVYYQKTGHGPYNRFWEIHELLTRYDFIRRTLGLPDETASVPAGSDYAKQLGADYRLWAEAYQGESLVPEDLPLAMQKAEISAKLGNGDGVRFVAANLLQKKNPTDTAKAIEMLKASAAENQINPAVMLGHLYHAGRYVERNETLSAQYYSVGVTHGKDATWRPRLAYSYCTGEGNPQQWDRCLELLDLNKYSALPLSKRTQAVQLDSWKAMRSVIADVYAHGTLTPAQAQDLAAILTERYETKGKVQSAELSSEVTFETAEGKTKKSAPSIAAEAQLSVEVKFESDDKNAQTGFVYDWQQIVSKDRSIRWNSGFLFAQSSTPLSTSLTLTENMEPGLYRVTIRDLTGKVWGTMDFNVIP